MANRRRASLHRSSRQNNHDIHFPLKRLDQEIAMNSGPTGLAATTRRSLLQLGSVLGAMALLPRRGARAQTVFVRPDINSQAGQRMLGLYSQAVQKMQDPAINYPPQPQSWTFHAYMHNLPVDPFHPVESGGFVPGSAPLNARIDLIYGQPAAGSPQAAWKAAAQKCWATCPHGSPWFVAWHRWYIFYFEQIVRSLSGAADFALPYWNYASDMGPSLQLPVQFQDPTNPLYEDLRGLGFYNPAGAGAQNLPMNDGGYLPFPATDYSPALSATALFPSDDSTNFADLPDPRYYVLGLAGRLEIQPHDKCARQCRRPDVQCAGRRHGPGFLCAPLPNRSALGVVASYSKRRL
jgi:tyrosinase